MLMAYEDKSAYALCAFSFVNGPDAEPITFLGKTPVSCSCRGHHHTLEFFYHNFSSVLVFLLS